MIPRSINAGLLSSILGSEVSASSDVLSSEQGDKNSQNMTLLQANMSPVSITQDKKDKSGKKIAQVDEDKSINIVSDNALLPSTSLMNVSGIDENTSSPEQISVYVIRKGDSIAQIADMFDVSVNTILMANDMKKGQKLKEGETLVILPISGSEHTVAKGQTLATIAKLYKVDVDEITSYNGIPDNAKLSVGDKILIPGGDTMMLDEGGDKPAPNLNTSVAKDTNYYLTHPLLNLFGFFINPVPTGHKTQGLHGPGHRGIDIGAPTGTSMYASAAGKVIAVKTGCKVGRRTCGGGYGNLVVIEHANNTKTLYAHMSKVATHIGDIVNQGEIIGAVGNTGRSTGPHIHFEVFNAKNPGVDWSWANDALASAGKDD